MAKKRYLISATHILLLLSADIIAIMILTIIPDYEVREQFWYLLVMTLIVMLAVMILSRYIPQMVKGRRIMRL